MTGHLGLTGKAFFTVLCLLASPVYAQTIFKCQIGNKTVFSHTACEQGAQQAEMRSRRGRPESRLHTYMTEQEAIIATNAKPLPLATALPVDLFNHSLQACDKSDYAAMLNQYSQEEQNFIQTHWPSSSRQHNLSDSLCKNMRSIVNTALRGRPENYRYATKKIDGRVMLCSYANEESISQCRSHVAVTIEEGRLKLDEH